MLKNSVLAIAFVLGAAETVSAQRVTRIREFAKLGDLGSTSIRVEARSDGRVHILGGARVDAVYVRACPADVRSWVEAAVALANRADESKAGERMEIEGEPLVDGDDRLFLLKEVSGRRSRIRLRMNDRSYVDHLTLEVRSEALQHFIDGLRNAAAYVEDSEFSPEQQNACVKR